MLKYAMLTPFSCHARVPVHLYTTYALTHSYALIVDSLPRLKTERSYVRS